MNRPEWKLRKTYTGEAKDVDWFETYYSELVVFMQHLFFSMMIVWMLNQMTSY
jgi:hypothetical protein